MLYNRILFSKRKCFVKALQATLFSANVSHFKRKCSNWIVKLRHGLEPRHCWTPHHWRQQLATVLQSVLSVVQLIVSKYIIITMAVVLLSLQRAAASRLFGQVPRECRLSFGRQKFSTNVESMRNTHASLATYQASIYTCTLWCLGAFKTDGARQSRYFVWASSATPLDICCCCCIGSSGDLTTVEASPVRRLTNSATAQWYMRRREVLLLLLQVMRT